MKEKSLFNTTKNTLKCERLHSAIEGLRFDPGVELQSFCVKNRVNLLDLFNGHIAAVTRNKLVVKPQVSSLRAFEESVNSFCQNMHTVLDEPDGLIKTGMSWRILSQDACVTLRELFNDIYSAARYGRRFCSVGMTIEAVKA